MLKGTQQLGHTETSLLIQARVEELDPQQVLARDLLVSQGHMRQIEATSYVGVLGPETSAVLKEALERAEDPGEAFMSFVTVYGL